MSAAANILLTDILTDLHQVGNLLDAIDRSNGNSSSLWQEISQLDHRLRRQANQLDEDIFSQLPSLAVFALSNTQIITCWGNCADEVEALLEADASQH